ncbi:MAG TPA: glycoside hydrolase family 6 protein [Candidatus Paceibacterota bacterium]|jgi:Cellobiohydrolase A (1,4-beta-cellobiosidase A)
MAKLRPLISRVLFACASISMWGFGALFTTIPATAHAANAVEVWWPAQNASVQGVQPFKAIVKDRDVQTYQMYWSVDNGNPVPMQDSQQDYPHKEAQVDLTNWKWNTNGTYAVSFIAKDPSGAEIARTEVTIKNAGQEVATQNTSVQSTPAPTPAPVEILPAPTKITLVKTVPKSISTVTGSLSAQTSKTTTSGSKFYVDPYSPAAEQAKAWKDSRPTDAALMEKMAAEPTALWLGEWIPDIKSHVSKMMQAAQTQNSVPVFVTYNIPGRDCGLYSAGGLSGSEAYLSWIQNVSSGIGSGKAMIILEPDALAGADCLSDTKKAERYSMISQSVDVFSANNPNVTVYIDAGNAKWIGASDMAGRLNKAGIAKAAGFALNVSNFFTTEESTNYGTEVSKLVSGKHFVIDTSRNGSGSNGEWCNPTGRSLGKVPSTATGTTLVDAYLWVKVPGQSDGNCNGAPAAGGWWADYALDLAKRAGY